HIERTGVTASGSQTRTRDSEFDAKGIFVSRVTDEEGYVTEYETEPVFGGKTLIRQLGSQSSGNSLTRYIVADGFGRVGYEVAPDGVATTTSYVPRASNDAFSVDITKQTGGGAPVTVRLDALDRVVRRTTQSLEGNDLDEITFWNANGQVDKVFHTKTD